MNTKSDDEHDVPFGNLPTAGRIVLVGNKIVTANAEARFLREEPGINESEAGAIWALLGKEEFPFFEHNDQKHVNVNITDSGVEQTHEVNKVWILSNPDRSLSVILMPSAVIVQVLKYVRFGESLAEPFARAIEAYVSVTTSAIIQRIGLRYINRLTDADAVSPVFWSSKVRTAFSGPIEGTLENFVTGSHQQVQLSFGPTVGAMLHSGVFADSEQNGTYSCLIDVDVYSEQALDFDASTCSNLTRRLNRTAYALFAQTLSPEFISQMEIQGEASKKGEKS